MVTASGRAKVLDFGLAKVREAEAANATSDLTGTGGANDVTGEGSIIGTVAYMSPEQAEGKPVDPRSDIFSLGVVLHEMATGERPFKGDTNVSVLSAILKDTPAPVTDTNPDLAGGSRPHRPPLPGEESRSPLPDRGGPSQRARGAEARYGDPDRYQPAAGRPRKRTARGVRSPVALPSSPSRSRHG